MCLGKEIPLALLKGLPGRYAPRSPFGRKSRGGRRDSKGKRNTVRPGISHSLTESKRELLPKGNQIFFIRILKLQNKVFPQ